MEEYSYRSQVINPGNGTGLAVLKERNDLAIQRHVPEVKCKFCDDSGYMVRYGTYKSIQRYYCKRCNRKFADNAAPPGMKTPLVQISSALSMFYEGMTLNAIRRHLQQTYNNYPSDSTIYDWIVRFTKAAVNAAYNYRANTGKIWIIDETVLKIGGQNIWFFDIVCHTTRFLLASHLSTGRSIRDIKKLILQAISHSTRIPDIIIADKLKPYVEHMETAFGNNTANAEGNGIRFQSNSEFLEKFNSNGALKGRTKIIKGMHNRETAKLITEGWLVHYNFFRPYHSLGGITPAQVADIKFPFRNWAEVVNGKIVAATD